MDIRVHPCLSVVAIFIACAMENEDEKLWEDVRLAMLRDIVDGTVAKLRRGDLTKKQVQFLLKITREKALTLFPDKEETYDLIYTPRFYRIILETYP